MPSNTVGGVSVTVRLDDKDALAQLANLRRKIEDAHMLLDLGRRFGRVGRKAREAG